MRPEIDELSGRWVDDPRSVVVSLRIQLRRIF